MEIPPALFLMTERSAVPVTLSRFHQVARPAPVGMCRGDCVLPPQTPREATHVQPKTESRSHSSTSDHGIELSSPPFTGCWRTLQPAPGRNGRANRSANRLQEDGRYCGRWHPRILQEQMWIPPWYLLYAERHRNAVPIPPRNSGCRRRRYHVCRSI